MKKIGMSQDGRILSLRKSPDKASLMLCLETEDGEVCKNITSHIEYATWLKTQKNLLSIKKENWWNDRINGGSRYVEFHTLRSNLCEIVYTP